MDQEDPPLRRWTCPACRLPQEMPFTGGRRKQWCQPCVDAGNRDKLWKDCEYCATPFLGVARKRFCSRQCGGIATHPGSRKSSAPLRAALQAGDREACLRILLDRTRPEGGCRIWTGAVNNDGYGTTGVGSGKTRMAHRLVAEMAYGIDVSRTSVHHKCAQSACIEPTHLQWVTPEENTAEMVERRFYQRKIAALEARVSELERRLGI